MPGIIWLSAATALAQQVTLANAIQIAQENSLDAKSAHFSFLASYWTYRSFKAELLPSINLSGGLMNYNRSLVEARNYDDGRLSYVSNNTLSNSLTLSVDQQIAATGGTVSLMSYLHRLDQFTYKETTYNSQPLRISYTQPLRAFNSLKWQKKTAPLEYEIAQKRYASAMQDIAIRVTTLFFNVLYAQSNYQQSKATLADRETLYAMAQKRLELGTTTKSEVLQMELSVLNARVAEGNNRITLDDAMYNLFSYLRVTDYEASELVPPYNVPDLVVGMDEVLQKAIANSSHTKELRFEMLNADTFQHLLITGQKSVEEVVSMSVDLLKTVHSRLPKPGVLPSRLDVARKRLALISPLFGLIVNYFSRKAEYRADEQAVKEGYGEDLVSALKKLARQNFSDLAPSPLLVKLEYSHPTLSQRINAIAENTRYDIQQKETVGASA